MTVMKQINLKVEKRKVFGKKLKALRRDGILPGNVYGKDIESTAVQLPVKEFQAVYDEVGSSGVVYLDLDGKSRPVLIHALAYDYVNRQPLHADFFQVNLKEKVRTTVPLEVVGEANAVTEKVGMLMQPVSEVEVEALPTELPEHLEIDVTDLTAVGDQKMLSDVKVPSGVTILTPDQVIASIAELVSEEAEEQAAEEAAAAETASTEGETPAEGAAETPAETPAEEKAAE